MEEKTNIQVVTLKDVLPDNANVEIKIPEDNIIKQIRENRKTIWLIFCGLVILGALSVSIFNIVYATSSINLAWGLLGTLLGIVLKDIGKLFE